MNNGYQLVDQSQANEKQQEIFNRAESIFGFVPNIVKAFSASPVLANTMLDLYKRTGEASFDPTESHVVLQTINVLNECIYCVPAHSTVARSNGVDSQLDEHLRASETLEDSKLEALRIFTTQMVQQRGHITSEQFQAFIDAGYTKESALEVIYFHTMKALTNYGNHITGTDLDDAFKPLKWEPEQSTVDA